MKTISDYRKEGRPCDYNRRITKPFLPQSVHASFFPNPDLPSSSATPYNRSHKKNNFPEHRLAKRQMSNIKDKINKCHTDLQTIQYMEENTVCEKFNVDRKEEIIELIMEELKDLLAEYEEKTNQKEKEELDFYEAIRISFGEPNRQLLMNL